MKTIPERAIDRAVAKQNAGDLAGAARAFLAILEIAPTDHRLPDEAGNIYLYGLNQAAAAIPCYEKALKLLPRSEPPGRIWIKLGLAHSLCGHDKPALTALSKAGKEDPSSVLVHVELGNHHSSQARYQDAFEHFVTAHAHFHMQHHFGSAMGGPGMDPHLLALALMGKARASLVHMKRRADGMGAVRELFDTLEDYQRGVKLAGELRAAGKTKLALEVLNELLDRAPKDKAALALKRALVSEAAVPARSAPRAAKKTKKATVRKKTAKTKTTTKTVKKKTAKTKTTRAKAKKVKKRI